MDNEMQDVNTIIDTVFESDKNNESGALSNESKKIDNTYNLRLKLAKYATFLIIIQTIFVFGIAIYLIFLNQLKDTQSFLTLIIGLTLGESYLIFKLIVEFAFSDKIDKIGDSQIAKKLNL
jgi:hypothetical protein